MARRSFLLLVERKVLKVALLDLRVAARSALVDGILVSAKVVGRML